MGVVKRCYACGDIKSLEAFQRDRSRADGRQSLCKPCNTERLRQYRRLNPKVIGRASKRWEARNRDKRHAHDAVRDAIRTGRLERESCEVCGATAQAHHDDYSKPLDVRWLCPQHHADVHAKAA